MRRQDQVKRIARDCVHFKGDQPCQPHRRAGAVCRCPAYSPQSKRILIIQLSPPEAVTRAGALAGRFVADDPNCHITFLTDHPELLDSDVAAPLKFTTGLELPLQMDHFDAAYNLDPDRRACAIMNLISAETKKGFHLRQGRCTPIDEDAYGHYLSLIFPRAFSANRPDPLPAMFQMCGLEYRHEKPQRTAPQAAAAPRTTVAGLFGPADT